MHFGNAASLSRPIRGRRGRISWTELSCIHSVLMTFQWKVGFPPRIGWSARFILHLPGARRSVLFARILRTNIMCLTLHTADVANTHTHRDRQMQNPLNIWCEIYYKRVSRCYQDWIYPSNHRNLVPIPHCHWLFWPFLDFLYTHRFLILLVNFSFILEFLVTYGRPSWLFRHFVGHKNSVLIDWFWLINYHTQYYLWLNAVLRNKIRPKTVLDRSTLRWLFPVDPVRLAVNFFARHATLLLFIY